MRKYEAYLPVLEADRRAGEKPLRKKGKERSMRVSDFLWDIGSRLAQDDEETCKTPTYPLKLV